MFGVKIFLRLLARLWCDQVEAQSEAAHEVDPSRYRIRFTESARQDLERLASISPEEWKRKDEEAWQRKMDALAAFAQTHPAKLICDRQPFFPRGYSRFEGDDKCWYKIVLELGPKEAIDLCHIMSLPCWNVWCYTNKVNREEPQPPSMTRRHKVVEAPELSLDLVTSTLRDWLKEYCPELSKLPIEFLPDEEMGRIALAHFARRTAKAMLDQKS